MRIAQINDCRVCQTFRAPRDVVGRFDEDSVPEDGVRARRRPLVVRVQRPRAAGHGVRRALRARPRGDERGRVALGAAARGSSPTTSSSSWRVAPARISSTGASTASSTSKATARSGRSSGSPSRRPRPLPGARTDGRRSPRQRVARQAARRARPEDRARPRSSSARSSTTASRSCTTPRATAGSRSRRGSRRRSTSGSRRRARRSAPTRNAIGFGMGAPTIVTHGTEEQKSRYLRPLFTGEEMWCQLFSEPGAGSDVAGLSTRADPRRRRVDRERPEGVDVARALREVGHPRRPHRTPTSQKHKGLTYFVVDMDQPASRSGRCGR